MFLNLLRQVILLIPLVLLLPLVLKIDGVWLAGPVADIAAAAITAVAIKREVGRLNEQGALEPVPVAFAVPGSEVDRSAPPAGE